MPRLDKDFYLEQIRRDASLFLEAARQGSNPPLPAVPCCPEWNMADLTLHMGYVHRLIANRVRKREREFRDYNEQEWEAATQLAPRFLTWVDHGSPTDEPIPPELLMWFEEGANRLLETLEGVDPSEAIGTWFPPDQTGGFWQRRMAHETAVHRWDAQSAVGDPEPIDTTLARDGIDETFDVQLPMRREWAEPRPSAGESYHFHATDGEGEWLIRFTPDGVSVTREHGKADVAIRGTTSDLVLFLWGRVPADRLDVLGDPSQIDRYFELVPPD